MNRNKLTGWKDVYAFTFMQMVKGKSFMITTLILCLVALAAFPIKQLYFSSHDEQGVIQSIQSVYVVDESGLDLQDFTDIANGDAMYKNISFVPETRTVEEITKELEHAQEQDKSILLHITWEQEGYFSLNYITGTKSGVKEGEVTRLSDAVTEYFDEVKLKALDISNEQMELINIPTETKVKFSDEHGAVLPEGDEQNENVSMSQYYIMLAGVILVIFVIAFSGESIASSIITEKSTRVIEYLMTSIRPLAIIIGKILAMLTIVFLQFTMLFVSTMVSGTLTTFLQGGDENQQGIKSMIDTILASETFHISPLNVLLVLLIVIVGFLFYGTLAGLAGATVSKIEEMAEGLKIYNFIMIIGSYMGIALGMVALNSGTGTGVSTYQALCYLLPISSPFVLPSNLLLGKAPLGWALGGLAILILSLVLLFLLVAKVYEGMILYNGSALKIKDIWNMAKTRKERSE